MDPLVVPSRFAERNGEQQSVNAWGPTQRRIKVLFIAMEFPPMSTAGVFRSLKFCKYMGDHGVDPIVLTFDAETGPFEMNAPIDPSLTGEIPPHVPIERIPCAPQRGWARTRVGRFLNVFFRIEDSLGRRWRRGVTSQMDRIVAHHKPDAVYVTMPPFSAGRIAEFISKRFQLPLVIDMRDGWSHWCTTAFASWLHYWLTVRREARLFSRASAVVTVTPQLAAIFRRTHAALPSDRIHVVSNGFDGELPAGDIKIPHSLGKHPFVVRYAGSFYYSPQARASMFTPWWRKRGHRMLQYSPVREDWLYRSPYFFLRAVARLYEQRPELRGRIRLEVAGNPVAWLPDMATELGVEDSCVQVGRLRHEDVRAFQNGADALLCTAVKVPGGDDYAIASKTFDYVLTGKPLLGFTGPGAQRDFLSAAGVALIVDPDDADAGATVLERLLRGGIQLTPNRSFLSAFHRRSTAGQMAAVIRRVTAPVGERLECQR